MTLQLGLEGMRTRPPSCTPSRLTTWLDCPPRYRMTYLDRPASLDRRSPAVARVLLDPARTRDGFLALGPAKRPWEGLAEKRVEP